MANYSQYTSLPNWGTSQFQFLTPPVPSYQPQPSWGGLDFYRAHAGNVYDSALYDQIWSRAQPLTAATAGGTGIGLAEAQYWHRRIYGGLTDMRTVLPSDIGAAAAYEAYRTFQTHTSIYAQPLLSDPDPHGRMREALVGMAVAEVSRLWQFAGRADRMGMMQACEVAAFTVSRIWYEAGAGGAGMGVGMGGMGGMGVGMGAGINPGMGSGMGGGLGGRLSPGQLSPISFGGGAGGLSPLRSPAISLGIAIPGMHSPRFAPSNTLGLPQPPPFSRRRSRSVGALGAPGVGYGASAGYGAGAGMGMEAAAAIQRALTPTMLPGAGMPVGGGAYPYAASGGAYPYAAGGGQGYTTDPYAYMSSSSSSHRPRSHSRHRHHHRHRSHSRSRQHRNPLEDPLAYGATYSGMGGQLPVGGQGGVMGNAAAGYAAGGYGGSGYGGYGGGGGGYGGGYPYAGSGYRY